MRDAVLTVSPNRQYLGIFRPTTPAHTGPIRYTLHSTYQYCTVSSVVVMTCFRSRDQDRDLDKMNSSLEAMISRSHHWLHQFQLLVTDHSLKGAANYGNRATGVGTKHAVLRPRPRPRTPGLETKTETWTKWTRVSRPWSRDHNTDSQFYSVGLLTTEIGLYNLDALPEMYTGNNIT